MLHTLQHDPQYDYARELAQSDFSIGEWLWGKLAEVLMKLLGSNFYANNERLIWLTIAVVFVAVAGAFVWGRYRRLRLRREWKAAKEVPEADTIYGIDFDERIAEALRTADHREAVRLIYLQTLRRLSDMHRIDWQIFKTPTQYTYEVQIQVFRLFTNHFLRVRYGDFAADRSLVDEMGRLQTQIYADLQIVAEAPGGKGGTQ